MTRLACLLLTLALAVPASTPPASFPAPTASQPSVPHAAGPASSSAILCGCHQDCICTIGQPNPCRCDTFSRCGEECTCGLETAGPSVRDADPPAQAAAAPTITAPAKLSVKVGRFASVQVTTTGKSLILVSGSAELDAFREFTDPGVYVFRIIAYTPAPPGGFRVTWVSTLNDLPTQFVTEVVTDGKPPPIDPVDPPDPPPVDPLTKAFQDAYAADTGADKRKDAMMLAGVYGLVGEQAHTVTNLGALSALLATETKKRVPTGALTGVKKLATDTLRAELGNDAAQPFDPARAKGVFAKLARIVGGLK